MFGTFRDVNKNLGDGVSSTVDTREEAAQAFQEDGMKLRTYTMDEVARHTTKEDCWVVLHGRVLDVTEFLPRHPGGERMLLAFGGKDATKTFESIHPAGV